MKKQLLILLMTCLCLTMYSKEQTTLVVSPKGNDRSSGTNEKPLKSIQEALNKASKCGGDVKIVLKKGEYRSPKTIEISKGNWGSLNIYGEDGAKISGDIIINKSDVKKIADKAVYSRLQNEVKDKVVAVDCKKLGIDIENIIPVGFGRASYEAWNELVVNDKHLRLSRWPNDSMVLIGKIVVSGGDDDKKNGNLPIFHFNEKRPLEWANSENIWIAGYFGHGFADDMIKVKSISKSDTTIHAADFTRYQFFTGADFRRWYALNVLEEIDKVGEYVIDAENSKIYFLPPQEGIDKIRLTVNKEPLIAIQDCDNVTISNVIIENSRGIGVYMENTNNVVVDNCILRNLGSVAVMMGQGTTPEELIYDNETEAQQVLKKVVSRKIGGLLNDTYYNTALDRKAGTYNGVKNSYIYNIGSGGVILGGGDRFTLTSSNNFVENCIISNYNRIGKSYRAAIWMDGTGCRVTKCDIFDAPSMAILFGGNNHVIEYCKINDVCLEVDDQGAIYYGRDPSARGNIIRYNYFRELSPKHRVTATYHDDGACGSEVYGNIYHKAGSMPVLIGGGMDHYYYNNIFIESPIAFHIDNRFMGWGYNMIEPKGIIDVRLKFIGYNNDVYKKAYPELSSYWEDSPQLPKRNYIYSNLVYKVGNMLNGKTSYAELWDNWITDQDPGFVDINDPLKGFKPDAEVFKKVNNFKNIKFENIGSTLDKNKILK